MHWWQKQGRTLIAYVGFALAAVRGSHSLTSLRDIAPSHCPTAAATDHGSPNGVSSCKASSQTLEVGEMNASVSEESKKGVAYKLRKKARSLARRFRLERTPDNEPQEEVPESLLAFGDVMLALDLGRLENLALKTRLKLSGDPSWSLRAIEHAQDLTCTIDRDVWPMYGSYNMVFVIRFSDGVKWIARIPGHGTRFGEDDVEKLNSECYTMRYIKANTSIPLPEVYYWTTGCDRIGAPFALMSFVEGRSLASAWPTGLTEEKRLEILADIAAHISQLHQLPFDKMGTLRFDAHGVLQSIGPLILMESDLDCVWSSTTVEPSTEPAQDYLRNALGEPDEDMHFCQRALYPMLRMMIDTIPGYLRGGKRFALAPMDFNYQNIIINDDGRIAGFVDWDCVHTEPTASGCGRYPSWITRDWDPAMYAYDPQHSKEGWSANEESPEMLLKYRKHYAIAFAKACESFEDYDPRMTSQSHLLEALSIACNDSMCRGGIVNRLIEHAFNNRTAFKLVDYVNDFVAGDRSDKDMMLKEKFRQMWRGEWDASEEHPLHEDLNEPQFVPSKSNDEDDDLLKARVIGISEEPTIARAREQAEVKVQEAYIGPSDFFGAGTVPEQPFAVHDDVETSHDMSTQLIATKNRLLENNAVGDDDEDTLFWIDDVYGDGEISSIVVGQFAQHSDELDQEGRAPVHEAEQHDEVLLEALREISVSNEKSSTSWPHHLPAVKNGDWGESTGALSRYNNDEDDVDPPHPTPEPADSGEDGRKELRQYTRDLPKTERNVRRKAKAVFARVWKPLTSLKLISRRNWSST